MSKKIKILQIGQISWFEEYQIPEDLDWVSVMPNELDTYFLKLKEAGWKEHFALVLITDIHGEFSVDLLDEVVDAFNIIVDNSIQLTPPIKAFLNRKKAWHFNLQNPQNFIPLISQLFFAIQYGDKFTVKDLIVSSHVRGEISFEGNRFVTIEDDFGMNFKQVAFWRENKGPFEVPMEFWLEYEIEGDCEIELVIRYIIQGRNGETLKEQIYSQEDMVEPVVLSNQRLPVYISMTINARGQGKIKLGSGHFRCSRQGLGKFITGGQRFSDNQRQEFFYYYNPGNLKPPLNVYFSGYRPAEGFEGFRMMKSLDHPFILFSDPRIEGGAFYLGSEEYEAGIIQVIKETLKELEMTEDDLILSGLSMGTFGALYYGALLSPKAIIVGKPLVNIGNISAAIPLLRPNIFFTSLDVLQFFDNADSIVGYNQLLTDRLKKADWAKTTLAIAYMRHDDYDPDGYYTLLDQLSESGVHIISKGFDGRHNDNSVGINQWFYSEYERLIKQVNGVEE